MPPKRKSPNSTSSSSSSNEKSKVTKIENVPELEETPLARLLQLMKNRQFDLEKLQAKHGERDGCIVHWMRMKDLRLKDNRSLSMASMSAKKCSQHLIVLFVLCPDEYKAHNRSPARIDFILRNLEILKQDLDKLNIPLYLISLSSKKEDIPKHVVKACTDDLNASAIYGTIEYEVDELNRDIETYELGLEQRPPLAVNFVSDVCVVPPGQVLTGAGKPYSVFTPWYRNWCQQVNEYIDTTPEPKPNDSSARQDKYLKPLFDVNIPNSVAGFELGADEKRRLERLWPAGPEVAQKIFDNFLRTSHHHHGITESPAYDAGNEDEERNARIRQYSDARNRADIDGTSRLSPYFAAGIISARSCLEQIREFCNGRLPLDQNSSVGNWVKEVSWRDFYQHVMSAWPRVVKYKPFNLKYEQLAWEYNDEHLQAWKDGKTGFPFIDAGMRQLKEQCWMHNRARMSVAMFLTKDLMLDWHEGEKWFMENLIDGDWASNNGGWQWSASTGTDPQPYFRIFNPLNQSLKSDLSGDYIRTFVPELSDLDGEALHDPSKHLSETEFERLGYPYPIIDHATARKRALARYKNPGFRVDDVD